MDPGLLIENNLSSALGLPLLFAFLGGILLNLMPCVFPVLSIKVLSFLKKGGEHPAQVRAHGWFYTLGVLLSFWLLAGLLLLLRSGGEKLGWGFQLQSPVFLLVLGYIIFLLGLSLLGLFELGAYLLGFGSSLTQRPGYQGSFFTGVLATLVATPCLAPFMGPAIGIALTQASFSSFLIFTALGLGLALPYLLFSIFPQGLKLLPKPGRWMETFKQAMAFPLFGTVLWLLWIFDLQTESISVLWFLVGLLLMAFAAWLGHRLGGPGRSWGRRSLKGVTVSLIMLLGLGLGLWGIQPQQDRSAAQVQPSGKGLEWIPYSEKALEELRTQGTPVFINFTAAWCITCQMNDLVVFAFTIISGLSSWIFME